MFEQYLQKLGLSEREAKVYVSLLQVDNSSVMDLATKTKINRTTAYLVLDVLMKKGLVSETQIDKKTHYQAESPERLETYVETQKIVLEEQSRQLKDIIPQLKSIQREIGERPVVKYFEGREGVISASNELFFGGQNKESSGLSYSVYDKDMVEEVFSERERLAYRKAKHDRGIRSKSVYTYKKEDYPEDGNLNRAKIDRDKYPVTCDIAVFGDKTRISLLDKNFSGIFIQSQDLADTIKSLVNYIYDSQKKPS